MIDGDAEIDDREYAKRPPLRYISIELVRKLASQMDSGININPGPFVTLLPTGWYRVEYAAKESNTEEIEHVRRLVMVFEHEAKGYDLLINELLTKIDGKFYDEGVQLENVSFEISELQRAYFPGTQEHFGIYHRISLVSLGTLLRLILRLDFLALRKGAYTIWTWSQKILFPRIYQENKRTTLYDWNSIGMIVIGRCCISHMSYSRASTMAVLKGYFMHAGMVLVQRIT